MSKFVIRGCRGTMPSCEDQYRQYGGNTTCFSIHTDKGIIIIDAGTGLSLVTNEMTKNNISTPLTMLFTHFHMDHIIGLPCFEPLYRRNTTISIMADPRRQGNWQETLKTFVGKPYWPIGLGELDADMNLQNLPVEETRMNCYGIDISWLRVPHPQQCLSYRFKIEGKSVVVATDTEYKHDNINPDFINFCNGADFLIFDSQYTPEEYLTHENWGHSTWETATQVANIACVKELILTHHDPSRDDDAVKKIESMAKASFKRTHAAHDNMVLID